MQGIIPSCTAADLFNAIFNTSLVTGYITGVYMTVRSYWNYRIVCNRLRMESAAQTQMQAEAQAKASVYDDPPVMEAREFDYVSARLREFFKVRGFMEAHTQSRTSVLAAGEDPWATSFTTLASPLPQTGQIWLEHELSVQPLVPGYFCFSTSYRAKQDPVPGRHYPSYPIFEFEMHGDLVALVALEEDLLVHLGYPREQFACGKYMDMVTKYKTETLDHVHEDEIHKDFGPVFFLTEFPEYTGPHWNMKRDPETEKTRKVNVILSGQEALFSAERETCPRIMRDRFDTLSDGEYKRKLYDLFGKDRTELEMEQYLDLDFVERSSASIGLTRLIRSMKMEGLIPKKEKSEDMGTSICI